MKKITMIFLSMLLILTGCQSNKKASLDLEKQQANIAFKTEHYDLARNLNLYIDSKFKQGVPFVEVNEFLAFLKPASQKNEITVKDDLFKITIIDDSQEQEHLGYIEIDFKANTLKLSEYAVLTYLVPSNAYDESDLANMLFNDEELEAPGEVTFDLAKYNIPIEKMNDQYYMPLYLANFLFSGYDLEIAYVYADDYLIYPYSFSEDMTEEGELPFSDQVISNDKSHSIFKETLAQNVSFLNFVFDNFYGLKGIQGIKSYDEKIEKEFKIASSKDGAAFDENLNTFLYSLNDLHTSQLKQTAFIAPNETQAESLAFDNKYYMEFIGKIQDAACFNAMSEIAVHEVGDDTVYIEIPNFDGNINQQIADIMAQYADKANVFFDIRCNLGGFLADMNHLLKYTTNDGWDFFYGDLSNSFVKSNTKTEIPYKTPQKFYFVTSGATFSAANLTASVVKDNHLGTLIGQQSSGGTAAISIVTLPDSTTLSISGADALLQTKDKQLIENGIKPDIEIDFTKLNQKNYEQFIEQIVNATR